MNIRQKMRSLMKKKTEENEEIFDYLELPALVSFPQINRKLKNIDAIFDAM